MKQGLLRLVVPIVRCMLQVLLSLARFNVLWMRVTLNVANTAMQGSLVMTLVKSRIKHSVLKVHANLIGRQFKPFH